jgi:hypothetical protein
MLLDRKISPPAFRRAGAKKQDIFDVAGPISPLAPDAGMVYDIS